MLKMDENGRIEEGVMLKMRESRIVEGKTILKMMEINRRIEGEN